MATTTNFGWTTPDDTSLVKDGASAIRSLGSAVDTSMVGLKGGTTGQVLSKTSGTDMAFTWVARDEAYKGVSCKSTTAQSASTGFETVINFASEDFDTNSYHDNSTNNSRITIPTGLGGKYRITGAVNFANGTIAAVRISIRKNGTGDIYYLESGEGLAQGSVQYINGSMTLDLSAGDYVELRFFHNKGSSHDISIDTRFQADFLGA
jgi:hypothetical protein